MEEDPGEEFDSAAALTKATLLLWLRCCNKK